MPQSQGDSALEAQNLEQIEWLNQRGGRTLSIADLIEANTLDANMAGFLLYAVAHGASFLTAARPGNAGKSTVLANLLGFLPPGTQIVPVGDFPTHLERDSEHNRICVLAHEIGAGPYYGYIWGREVRDFFDLMNRGYTIASCIHADALEELTHILTGPPLSVPANGLRSLDLILFLHIERSHWSYRRRVALVYEADTSASSHHLLFHWDRALDRFEQRGPSSLLKRIAASSGKTTQQIDEEVAQCCDFIRSLQSEGLADFHAMRYKVLHFLDKSRPKAIM